jgi:hypothetical protein
VRYSTGEETQYEPADKQLIIVMMQKNPFTAYNEQGIELKIGFFGDINSG